jgi:hypothetical protein
VSPLISARHSGPCGRTFGPCNSKVATWARSWQSTSSSGLGCPRVQTRQPFFWHAASLGTPHTARFKALSPAARTAVYTRHDNLITAGNSTAIWCCVRAKGVKRQAGYRLSDRIARRANACSRVRAWAPNAIIEIVGNAVSERGASHQRGLRWSHFDPTCSRPLCSRRTACACRPDRCDLAADSIKSTVRPAHKSRETGGPRKT